MDLLSRLPLECLQIILQFFDDDNDLASLATLLRTNKYLSSAVLPYLYHDPFRKDFHSIRERQMGVAKEISSGKLLVLMLLSRLPPTSLPTALSLALAPPTMKTSAKNDNRNSVSAALSKVWEPFRTKTSAKNTTSTTSYYSSLDYFAHIRHLNMSPKYAEVDCRQKQRLDVPLNHAQQAYSNSNEFKRLYHARPLGPAFNNNWTSHPKYFHFYYHTILHHEVPWSLGFYILEQLQSLTIHRVYNIKYYIDVVHRLKNLERVDFLLCEMYENEFNARGVDADEDGVNELTAQLERTTRQDVTQFVQEHARLFPGRLKTVVCFDGDRHWSDQEFVNSLHMQIYRILPPLARPTHLGKDNWARFWAHSEATDLSNVQRILGRQLPVAWIDTLLDNRPLLMRCRSLRHLDIETLQEDIFDWAVKERYGREESHGRIITAGNAHNVQESSLQASRTFQPCGLAPLEQVDYTILFGPHINNLTEFTVQHTCAIDSLAVAFSQTLQKLTVSTTTQERLCLNIGRGWVDLLALTHLELRMAVNRLVIDPLLLTYCPNLIHLWMTDLTKEYDCQDIVPCQSADLFKLQALKLSGWPALTFDPATLLSTSKLTRLELSFGRPTDLERRAGFIPPLEDLNRSYGDRGDRLQEGHEEEVEVGTGVSIRRPHWSWNWDLPVLTELTLMGEFALRFEFRMLHGCPALEALTLDIRSTGREVHTRALSETDLVVPSHGTPTPSDLSSSTSPSPVPLSTPESPSEQIVLSKLKTLNLYGKWKIVSKMGLTRFVYSLAPKLRCLEIGS
ncbi:hypothetical protein BGZ97_000300 [Linnemannia gamsii]|uniref:F-box domain-containing protein n=1 Tax=Linnemannia gamsii TaxID=64522 RepID=A0A9P6UTL8_9FUNG|nr:hypothetical protein BGZ97_000300 [Linnemannia gamsii]